MTGTATKSCAVFDTASSSINLPRGLSQPEWGMMTGYEAGISLDLYRALTQHSVEGQNIWYSDLRDIAGKCTSLAPRAYKCSGTSWNKKVIEYGVTAATPPKPDATVIYTYCVITVTDQEGPNVSHCEDFLELLIGEHCPYDAVAQRRRKIASQKQLEVVLRKIAELEQDEDYDEDNPRPTDFAFSTAKALIKKSYQQIDASLLPSPFVSATDALL
jgi:hypothetical protein